jgi:hypothetical protein
LPTIQHYTRGTPVQLAISASPFMPVFEDLANDPRITGTVIASFSMSDFMRVTTDSLAVQWVDRYERQRASDVQAFNRDVENTLARAVDAVLLSVETGARPQQFAFRHSTDYVRTLPDRSQRADYESVDREAAYRRRVALYLSGEEPAFVHVPDLDSRFARLEELVQKIRSRGGEVAFVRFPTTRRIWEMDEVQFPTNIYWNALKSRTSAKTVHFAEHDSLAHFDVPDGVHLDYRDAPAFTAALAEIVFQGAQGGAPQSGRSGD